MVIPACLEVPDSPAIQAPRETPDSREHKEYKVCLEPLDLTDKQACQELGVFAVSLVLLVPLDPRVAWVKQACKVPQADKETRA